MRSSIALFVRISILVLAATPVIVAAQAAAPSAPASNKGTEIGNIIAGAIDTALPGISKLATAVVGIFKPKPADAAAAKPAVDKAVTDAQASIASQIKQEFKGIDPLAVQLDTLGPFLEFGFRASADLSKLMVSVSNVAAPSDQQWIQTKAQWAKVKGALNAIPFSSTDVQKNVPNANLQQLLLQILEAKSVTVNAIDVLITSKTRTGLIEELAELNSTLSTLNVVARIQVHSMSDEVHGLVQWANGQTQHQGPPKPMPVGIQQDQEAAKTILRTAATKRGGA